MEQRICFTLLAHVVIFAMHFSPTLSDAETWSISVGCFPRYMSPLIKVITQIAACLLGLASLLSCGLILWLAGPTLHVTVSSVVLFCWNLRSGPLGWISGMTFGYGGMSRFHWRNLTEGTVYVTSAVRWRGTELPMIICHPCNLEAEHAGNPWKRKCLFWIIIFQGFKNRGNISFW